MSRVLAHRAVLGVFALTAVLFLLSGGIAPALLSGPSLRTIGLLSSFVIIASFGQGIVILSGGLDLSIGSVITLGGVLVGAWVPQSNLGLWWAIPAILVIGSAFGAFNGFGVAILRIPAFVMTLATGIIVQSAVLEYTKGAPQATAAPQLIADMSDSKWWGVPIIIYFVCAFIAIASLVQDMSTYGRLVHAIGANPKAGIVAGLRSNWVTIGCYATSGLCASLCGVVLLGFVGAPILSMGDPYTMDSIAAVVVGGSSILGGVGTFAGTVGGALFLGVLSNDMTALGMNAAWRTLIQGAIIVLALIVFRSLQGERARGRSGSAIAAVKEMLLSAGKRAD
jgi:ribose transport system permease protein